MKKLAIVLSLILTGQLALAQVLEGAERNAAITKIFGEIKKASKGALGPNSYQTTTTRVSVMQNGSIISPPKNTLITVAFRSPKAAELANLDFYVGSRYGSNYFELHNTFQATPEERASLAFNFNHEALKARAEAKSKAYSMAKHQMLELFYMQKSPTSSLTKSYNQRGVADDGHEQKYYRLLADYLAFQLANENDYLVLVEFQKRSSLLPGKKTVSLSNVRNIVADLSTRLDTYLSPDKALEFRKIRNSIHNGMTKESLVQLNSFQKANAHLIRSEEMSTYEHLKSLITTYYTVDKETLNILIPAVKAELPEAAGIISALRNSGNNLNSLMALAQLASTARIKFVETRNIDLTHLIIRIEEFIQSELGRESVSNSADLITKAQIMIHLGYATGFLGGPQRNDLLQKISTQPEIGIKQIANALGEGVLMFEAVFQPALTDWKLVSTSVASFVDEGIRSSALITLDATMTDLKKYFPNAGGTDANFSIENEGVGYGYLVLVPREKTEQMTPTLTYQMIPVFEALPLDLGVVAAVISEEPQTPLSHVNIKSKNRGTPNVYIHNASEDSRLKELVARKALVRLELKDGAMLVREVALAEADAFWNARHNKPVIELRADLNEKRIRSTKDLRQSDVVSVGAKAANYAEGIFAVPEAFRHGFGIPFYYYREFIRTNKYNDQMTIEQFITSMLNDPRIKTDRQYLIDTLTNLQTRMRADDMVINPELLAEVKRVTHEAYPMGRMRIRSSTNSEDMPQFTGAGLYDSDAYDPNKPKKTLEKALKLVWSSIWNLRAYDERELFRINHADVSAAILVSPAYPNEIANGVGVGRNIIDPKLGEGVYLNIQQGTEAVTNPNPDITPDQVLVLFKKDPKTKTKYTLKYLKYSSLTKTEPVLPYAEVEKIADYLIALQKHFYKIYHPKNDNPKFALDVEFKVDTEEGTRKVHYKQARPFVGN